MEKEVATLVRRVFLTFKDALNHKDAQNFLRAGSARANARLTDSTTSL